MTDGSERRWMSGFLRASLGAGFGYVPGEQPGDAARWIKLNTNESPLPPSPAVAAAVSAAAGALNRYPSPQGEPLRTALAGHHGVEPSQVIVGNGADALINDCLRAFCEPGATVVVTEPTYSLLHTAARIHGLATQAVALDAEGRLPREFATAAAPLRVLVNPNTPTGTWCEPERLAADLAEAPGVVAIDEAYCDFAPRSCIPLLADHPAWLVLRTFSKSYALAGLRVGYAVGAAELIADLRAVGESYPVDRCALAGARAALGDQAHHSGLVETVLSERRRLGEELSRRGWQVTPSHANFISATPPSGTAQEAADRLRRSHVLVRCFNGDGAGRVRITVGSATETDALLAAIA
ncbi:MAG TPA: histidinol-phosphate transaminase [Candidatus Dormibacteraeota bacterium]|nr:histidinol-phosphate transaminase [Candidatus Dormibacteraeota bacterium]